MSHFTTFEKIHKLYIYKLSLIVATIFLFVAIFIRNTYIILTGLLMIIYSDDKVRGLREID
jgi:hypothetical protein